MGCNRSLYRFYGNGEAGKQPDIVSVTTAAPDRADVVIGLAESGCVKAIYATKPISVSLAEADAMIEACHQHNVIFALACHKNWSPWFQACLQAIEQGEIGQFRSMVCNFVWSLSRGHSHTLSLFRMFAGAAVEWVFGRMNSDQAA